VPLRIRSFRFGQGNRFDFSLSDLQRSGSVPDGITIAVVASDEYDDDNKLITKADIIARRRAE
jgi:hypothetical protein